MRKFLLSLLVLLLGLAPLSAQQDLDLTRYQDIDAFKGDFEDFNNSIYAGMNALTWTDASAPSVFRISAGVFLGLGQFSKNENLGLAEDGFAPSGLGVQVGFGTAGFEAYGRFFPESELFDASLKALGFGLKYELTDLIPVPAFPATAVFVEYNTQDFGVSKEQVVDVDNNGTNDGTVSTGINLGMSAVNFGALLSYDLIVARVYGKLAVETGTTTLDWNNAVLSNGQAVEEKKSGDIDSNGFRYALGLTAFGLRAEVGGRGSNLFVAVGYGISI